MSSLLCHNNPLVIHTPGGTKRSYKEKVNFRMIFKHSIHLKWRVDTNCFIVTNAVVRTITNTNITESTTIDTSTTP